jgi:SAM-dependent methyltransferase
MAGVPPKAAVRGQPSYVWRAGQERRLALIRRHVALENARILDVGCGIGTYVRRLGDLSPEVYGIDIELEHVRRGSLSLPNLILAAGEHMPFRTDTFDVVLLNEVIEHVSDDTQTLREATRVTRPGGRIAVYAPNRLYPFETHGVFIGRRYLFGNIPLINYLPSVLRRRLAPHVRAYTKRNLRSLASASGASWVRHTIVYPGFDNISARSRVLGGALRAILYRLENTPFRAFGLSHLLILEKEGPMGKGEKDG